MCGRFKAKKEKENNTQHVYTVELSRPHFSCFTSRFGTKPNQAISWKSSVCIKPLKRSMILFFSPQFESSAHITVSHPRNWLLAETTKVLTPTVTVTIISLNQLVSQYY